MTTQTLDPCATTAPSPAKRLIEISEVAVTRVMTAARKGQDPFEIGVDINDRRHAKDVCEKALGGLDASRAQRTAEAVDEKLATGKLGGNPDGIMPIDTLMARVMAAEGIDPLAAVWIALNIFLFDLDDVVTGRLGGQMDASAATDATNNTMCVIAGSSLWKQKGTLIVPKLSETMASAAMGRRLRDVVSHCILDTMPLTITSVETSTGGGHAFTTDHQVRPAKTWELIDAAPTGSR